MVYLPERANLFANAGPITRHALEFYSKLWAPYPFPQLTLQDGPSAGMEYPMVINSNQGAADHEAGHQWWPMMVGNNETWYGWMDEGFNQYMNILSDADERRARSRTSTASARATAGRAATRDEPPMMWNANYAGSMYGFQTYGKTPLMLSMLGGIVGDAAVQRAMSEYTKAWSVQASVAVGLHVLHEPARSSRTSAGSGTTGCGRPSRWTDRSRTSTTAGARTTVTVRQDGQMPSPVVLKVQFAATGPAIKPMANAKMVNDTTAIVTWPVDVWFNGSRTFQAVLDFGGRQITTITLDPAAAFPIAIRATTSGRTAPPAQRTAKAAPAAAADPSSGKFRRSRYSGCFRPDP